MTRAVSVDVVLSCLGRLGALVPLLRPLQVLLRVRSFLLFTSLSTDISLCFQCVYAVTDCAMSIKLFFPVSSVVSIYPHRLLAFRQNVRPGEGSVPTGPTTGKLQSLMTSRAEKGTQDLMR